MTMQDYPWTKPPLIIGAPMRLLALAPLATQISLAHGIGFIGIGDALHDLDKHLSHASDLIRSHPDSDLNRCYVGTGILPVGFGYFSWSAREDLELVVAAVEKWRPAAVWQFGAYDVKDYAEWAGRIGGVSGGSTKVWVQVGSVADAVSVVETVRPDVLVVQGTDAGGHGLKSGAGIVSLLPEVADALIERGHGDIPLIAAGGIVESRGVAAALMLGASGVCLGTRFLASEEVEISDGYRNEVVRASDGGIVTARTGLYDSLRGTTLWPKEYNARGILNRSFRDHQEAGMTLEENKSLYEEEVKKGEGGWGPEGRMTTYAGTGVGLIGSVMKAGDIVRELQEKTVVVMEFARAQLG